MKNLLAETFYIVVAIFLTVLLCAWVALVIFVSVLLGPIGWLVGPFVLLMTLGIFAQ